MTTTTTDPTTTDDLLYDVDGHVGIITLNRPDRLNAISSAMLEALSAQLVACQKDREIRVVILTGSGRGFCSGLDLQEQGERLREEGESGAGSG